MADAIERLLEGWSGPEPAPDFVDRTLERVDAGARRSRRRAFAIAFGLGGVAGAVAVAATLGAMSAARPELAPERATLVRMPGGTDVVAEPGAIVRWRGEVLEIVEGVAWVRVGDGLAIEAGGEAVELGAACGRIAAARGLFSVDVTVDDVECPRVDAAIVEAELDGDESR